MKNSMLPVWAVGLLFLAITGADPASAARQGQFVPVDVSQRGPQVGESIPEFTLEDQFGQTWTDASIIGPNGTMLVFIRSADW